MVKPATENSDRNDTYQQALDDFAITELLSHLRNYCDADFNPALMNLEEQELESLAAILIQRLTKNLKGKLIASYLNAIRHGDSDVICDPTRLEIPPPSTDLPANFPNDATPRHQEGDRVIWHPVGDRTDWGIAIGRYYNYAPHRCDWGVCYVVKLDEDSPSRAWTVTDTVWEDDLESSHPEEAMGRRGDRELGVPNFGANLQAFYPISLLLYPQMASRLAIAPKSLQTTPGSYGSGGGNGSSRPRPLTQREQNLIVLYSNCQLGMTPRHFHSKWSVTYEQIAAICDRSLSTVRRWFLRGRYYRRPASTDLRHLALMDFLLEHFEEIPSGLRNFLGLPNPA